jgi:hypothetical protein
MAEEESSSSNKIADTTSTKVARSQVTDSGAPSPSGAGPELRMVACFAEVIIRTIILAIRAGCELWCISSGGMSRRF